MKNKMRNRIIPLKEMVSDLMTKELASDLLRMIRKVAKGDKAIERKLANAISSYFFRR